MFLDFKRTKINWFIFRIKIVFKLILSNPQIFLLFLQILLFVSFKRKANVLLLGWAFIKFNTAKQISEKGSCSLFA